LNFFVDKIPAFGRPSGDRHPLQRARFLRHFLPLLAVLALLPGACSRPAIDMMQRPPASLRGAAYLYSVEISLGATARREVAASDAAVAARHGAGDAALPFATLLTQLFNRGAGARGLREGRALTFEVELDRLRITNAGGALVGRDDRVAGLVRILDARTREALGTFYVDIDRRYPGLIGLAVREGNGGVRERLAAAFVRRALDQIAPNPTGGTPRPPAPVPATSGE
jgi:hypothetical protein